MRGTTLRNPYDVLIIGAGPAGLTAGYLLSKHVISSVIVESSSQVGGISRTPCYKNFYFDIGGHRFFSKSDAVEKLWDEMLPNQLLTRSRSSRIFYQKKFYHYPLKPWNALKQLGVIESMLCIASYVHSRIKPCAVRSFSDWVINHFGKRLYLHFFKTYTEKVWGMPCESISAHWAAQRIQNLSLFSAIKNALLPSIFKKRKKATIKSLTDSFRYPEKGPGMLWESCAKKYEHNNGTLIKNARVVQCEWISMDQLWKVGYQINSELHAIFCKELISSAPIQQLVCDYLHPQLDPLCIQAARQLRYRDFLIVVLIVKDKNSFTDNWIYIHDRDVDVGRIQNFKSWSPHMVPDPAFCSYGMEYFCHEGDCLWAQDDDALIQKASDELIKIGLVLREDIVDGCVVRQPKAYPVYDHHYQTHLQVIQQSLSKHFPHLHLVGRNGLHKYNNQDHSMMTAMMTVDNIASGEMKYNVWDINQDDEYHESGLREVPQGI
ncbi:MAG: FAD-dependent oxidoreductase [Gammaproteobacteria bacterium RIFCSPLOWO2_02_FULL_42_14]|nr:MAG: FAD-dependent oxidoreductase [Gammaproteobacteria bacterium RIFCSPHIGHO2_02_FULL_42_43]OGT51531.1 MAG: FAD-dependent oxidoreductase [Gammaproteobacteria bacterium RIFCSPHIGHO2_12_FULL_41_25]OGT62231.1 MAG: FAD-dependent oxidoreductase [Gammaproteobacteria bacterium RIFCSPLOWO2_02_FULL_42_14]OGT85905.1 MAG: FAD-dependent oxidoreductase [Gammaproteobacteria bacterium RIFCSPLOWO2_12_FULL_42_18]